MSIILLLNPGFDPFTGVFSNPSDYYESGAEDADMAFLDLYDALGIDIDYYASNGLPNPVSIDQVPTELLPRLIGNAHNISLTYFLNQVKLAPHGITMNYESNYVYSLEASHPIALADAVKKYNIEISPALEDLNKYLSPPVPAPKAPNGYYGPE